MCRDEDMAIRITILDDHPLVTDGLEQLLRLEPDFEVVAKCRTVGEAQRSLRTHPTDVVLLDLKLRGESGLTLLESMTSSDPAVLVLTASEDEHEWLEAVRLGARGVVLKATAPASLARSIRAVASGRSWSNVDGVNLESRLERRQQVERRLSEQLTPRELEVMRELAARRDNDEIAARLGLAIGTVKLHVHHVYEKLGVSSRTELLAFLARRSY
jgi:DNA-binding NarL/FixJ family response regulator